MKNNGFTLIELVAVIVLLGILSVTALPRFVNLQGDAHAAVLQGLAGAMNSAKNMAYAKALVAFPQAVQTTNERFDLNGDGLTENIVFGYPRGWIDGPTPSNSGITNLIDFDFYFAGEPGSAYVCDSSGVGYCAINIQNPPVPLTTVPRFAVVFLPDGYSASQNCFAYYYQATDGGAIQTGFNAGNLAGAGTVTSGC